MPLSSSRLALLSVTDKSGLVPFARGLVALGYELLSTGGTAKLLREHDVPVADVATYTGSPEIMDGRVKTLHPKIHGGILYDRAQAAHVDQAAAHGIRPIDLVVVNLYRFAAEAVAKQLSRESAIEHIDIGGPTMLRAAAKNWLHATPLLDPSDYPEVLRALQSGGLSRSLRQRLAAKTFAAISAYDQQIAAYLTEAAADAAPASLGASLPLELRKVQDLRYGENPHQMAGLYVDSAKAPSGLGHIQLLSGKELSYNNILDLDAATA
ncbi:MAG: bifunctional phosphoribosylaminoimidazolecarboxamide formyltransferase/IMP cyclohydrolase, partial [Proteobacteria bacterium]|nr:bifunctional phosphoribosylaminoimidazolecarboxamide formyltransferase/IMP cyclohydrolase [Pseudomonadota bacterium]